MNIALWIIAGVLALAFLAAGAMKLTRPKAQLAASGMDWAANLPPAAIKTLGAAEVLGAVGLILPGALGIAPVLVPLAAVGLVLIMIGAVVLHGRRKETQGVAVTAILLILAGIVAWARFGPYPFA